MVIAWWEMLGFIIVIWCAALYVKYSLEIFLLKQEKSRLAIRNREMEAILSRLDVLEVEMKILLEGRNNNKK